MTGYSRIVIKNNIKTVLIHVLFCVTLWIASVTPIILIFLFIMPLLYFLIGWLLLEKTTCFVCNVLSVSSIALLLPLSIYHAITMTHYGGIADFLLGPVEVMAMLIRIFVDFVVSANVFSSQIFTIPFSILPFLFMWVGVSLNIRKRLKSILRKK